MTVTMRNAIPFKLYMKVSACSSGDQLDVDISFPLGKLKLYMVRIFSRNFSKKGKIKRKAHSRPHKYMHLKRVL